MPEGNRFKITIEYDGTNFVGWQRQANHLSVQEAIETAIHGFCHEHVATQVAGRTDSGVHALAQVAHFDLSRSWDPLRIREALNYHLKPHPITIIECEAVGFDFEARFSAKKRHYRYRVSNRRGRPALDLNRVWHVPQALNAELMHEAAQHLVGKHDFTTFRAANCQANSPQRTLDEISVKRHGDEIVITCSARSFLHHMVRSFVGSLKMVGDEKWLPIDMKNALEAKSRSWCGSLAPSTGLYLTHVDYPDAKLKNQDAEAADDASIEL